MVAAAFPFIKVEIDTSALTPVAVRAPGVIAVVGSTDGVGAVGPNQPQRIDTLADAAVAFTANGTPVVSTPLYRALRLALLQNPRPSKIYGVRADGGDVASALASLDAADDVTFVSLAETPANAASMPALGALRAHAENNSAAGQKRIAVMSIDPSIVKTPTYAADVAALVDPLKSTVSRVAMVAVRGAVDGDGQPADAATAAMAAIAGYPPHISMVLKRLLGIRIPLASQYSSAEIIGLSEAGLLPIIDPALIVGESLHFAEGRLFTTDASQLYIDIVRTLDDIDFRLRAGLIGLVGDARITRPGLIRLKTRIEGILDPLRRNAVIDAFAIDIPLLSILGAPETTWTAGDQALVAEARANRTVDAFVSITYGPAIHQLRVTLRPKF